MDLLSPNSSCWLLPSRVNFEVGSSWWWLASGSPCPILSSDQALPLRPLVCLCLARFLCVLSPPYCFVDHQSLVVLSSRCMHSLHPALLASFSDALCAHFVLSLCCRRRLLLIWSSGLQPTTTTHHKLILNLTSIISVHST